MNDQQNVRLDYLRETRNSLAIKIAAAAKKGESLEDLCRDYLDALHESSRLWDTILNEGGSNTLSPGDEIKETASDAEIPPPAE